MEKKTLSRCISCGTISSTALFDPTINPGHRLDARYGLGLAAIEEGRLELLRELFDGLIKSLKQGAWWERFRKAKSFQQAEETLLYNYGIKNVPNLPGKFRKGMRVLLRQLLKEEIELLSKRQAEMVEQAKQLRQILLEENIVR